MIKLIVSDLDGTLADGSGQISGEIFDIIAKLNDMGIMFVPASGRQYYNLYKQFERVKDDIIIISDNGSVVTHKDKVISLHKFENEIISNLVKHGHTLKSVCRVATGVKRAYIENSPKSELDKVEFYYPNNMTVNNILNVEGDEFVKYTLYRNANDMCDLYEYFKEFASVADIKIAGKSWIDINPKGVNKGIAVKDIQNMFNISPEQTMVFGDYMNDYEMLQSGYYSYAMENAHPEIKNIARYIAPSNIDNGVIKIIKEVVLKES